MMKFVSNAKGRGLNNVLIYSKLPKENRASVFQHYKDMFCLGNAIFGKYY